MQDLQESSANTRYGLWCRREIYQGQFRLRLMARRKTSERLKIFRDGLGILRLISRAPLTLHEISLELKMHERTARRWVDCFQRAGIPLAIDFRLRRFKNGRATAEKTYRLRPQDWSRLINKELQNKRS